MDGYSERLRKLFSGAPDETVRTIVGAVNFGDVAGAIDLLRSSVDLLTADPLQKVSGNRASVACPLLERLLKVNNPSVADLETAVRLVVVILAPLTGSLIDRAKSDQQLAQELIGKNELEKLLTSQAVKLHKKSCGVRSGQERRRQISEDLDKAANAYNVIIGASNTLSPTRKNIARLLEREGTPMSYTAKNGWQGRLKSKYLPMSAIRSRAATIRANQ